MGGGDGVSGVRVALYSHDTMGLGHMRRNLLIAEALRRSRLRSVVLMIAGAREANFLTTAAGVDCIALPSLRKDADGRYGPRHLEVSLSSLLAVRAWTTRSAMQAFQPDVLIVDNVPRGALGELDPVLEWLRRHGRTRIVLGLRDVLDDPVAARAEWEEAANQDAIRRYYDAVWVYGDPVVYDPVREYAFAPDVAAKVRYTGYLDPRARLKPTGGNADPIATLGLPPGRLALCLVGGGQDGVELARAFAAAELPPDTNGVLITGPFMATDVWQRLHHDLSSEPRRRVLSFLREPTLLLSRADRVVAMGGYNTVCEVLTLEKSALIVPRVKPRREQLIRAERLRALGLVDVLHPDHLSSGALSAWLAREPPPVRRARETVRLDGLRHLPRLIVEVLGGQVAVSSLSRAATSRYAVPIH
jgi:predicted glycosyltransferase